MTGCPNGCARPYNSDVGLVGKAAGKYTVLLGGRLLGNRMNVNYKDMVLARIWLARWFRCWLISSKIARTAKRSAISATEKGVANLQEWAAGYANQVTA